MSKLIDCSSCHMTLQLPPSATAIRCTNCNSVTRIPAPRNGLLATNHRPNTTAPPNNYSNNYNNGYNYNNYNYNNGYNNNNYMPLMTRQPAGPFPHAQGRKKAVIIGISYRNTEAELMGCVNDAKLMSYLLINKFNFPESSIHMLTDEGTDPYRIPTKRNIRREMYWLVQGCKAGDSMVFHYAGHGGTLRNNTLDEIDGYDETIVPVDSEKEGVIVDDEINATIVRPLPRGVKLHAIMDCCHSGTVLDLPYLCRMKRGKRYEWEDHRPRSGVWQGTSGGIAISISGCDDHQLSDETSALDDVNQTGAMTFAFIEAIERGQRPLTYGSLLSGMRSIIREISNDQGEEGGVKKKLAPPQLQEPQLSANESFYIYKKTFSL